MKLRITQKHYETYTGQMGITFFENGLSVTDVINSVAGRMAAVMQCEWEDGSPANVGHIYLNNLHMEAPVEGQRQPHAEAPLAPLAAQGVAAIIPKAYTEEQLGEIADKSGISGLREIADPMGLKSNSIGGLIQAIMAAEVVTPKVEIVEEPVVEETVVEEPATFAELVKAVDETPDASTVGE